MNRRLLFLFSALLIILASCTAGRMIIYNFADIKDYKKFANRPIQAPSDTWTFSYGDSLKPPKTITADGESMAWRDFLEEYKSVAFLLIRNDTILIEDYLNGYDEESIVTSFSVAKSVVSILYGIAIEEGIISGVDEPVTQYIPELKEAGFDKVTIEHLLQMTSGLKFNESYANPFGEAANYYYGSNLERLVTHAKLENEPGAEFNYVSGDTQILTLILSRALGEKAVSAYFEEKIWKPLGMEFDASWSLDKKDGLEKGFCCLNMRARDFAKIGRLYLNKGNWNGTQIVPADWVAQSTKVDSSNGSADYYQYQWWLFPEKNEFYANGILGQYIFVSPDKNIVAVRLGKKTAGVGWSGFISKLSESYGQQIQE
ncbi:serine hydrolase [Cryomorphaceae bacterium 1068]|nr:serine hydrolase [Cryomorphaceae bacterium 1068]